VAQSEDAASYRAEQCCAFATEPDEVARQPRFCAT
jgi:hypothetical protein